MRKNRQVSVKKRSKSSVRAKVEHVFAIIKKILGPGIVD